MVTPTQHHGIQNKTTMKKTEIKNIETLVGKFFDGDTTQTEEQRLYSFFSSRRVPSELEKYRETLTAFGLISKREAPVRARRITLWRTVASVAAAAVIAFGVMTYINLHEERMLAAIYGGSYVIENGHRTDNLRQIKDDIKTALSDAKTIEHHANNSSTVDDAEQDVLNNIDDPDMRREVQQMLN